MMAKKDKDGICAYCGQPGEVSRDHVPPRALFMKPYPSNMITVPACAICHNQVSLEDEYFLIALGFVLSSDETKHAKFLTEKIKRALSRPEARKLKSALKSKVKELHVHSVGGIYLGREQAINFEWSRLKFFAKRILIGLHHSEKLGPVRTEYQACVFLSWLQMDNEILDSPQIKELLCMLSRSKNVVIGPNTLQYWYLRAGDDSDSSFWYIRIAEEFGFFGMIGPDSELIIKG